MTRIDWISKVMCYGECMGKIVEKYGISIVVNGGMIVC
jgi:hypothetical protein